MELGKMLVGGYRWTVRSAVDPGIALETSTLKLSLSRHLDRTSGTRLYGTSPPTNHVRNFKLY